MKRRVRQKEFRTLCYGLVLALCCVCPALAQDGSRKVLKQVQAQYPSILKSKGIGGTVRLRVTVKADGTVKDIEVAGGNAILADSAVAAVKQWKFAPANAESIVNVAVVYDPNK